MPTQGPFLVQYKWLVPSLGCTLPSPGQLQKYWCLSSTPTFSNSIGWEWPDHQDLWKHPGWFQRAVKAENHQHQVKVLSLKISPRPGSLWTPQEPSLKQKVGLTKTLNVLQHIGTKRFKIKVKNFFLLGNQITAVVRSVIVFFGNTAKCSDNGKLPSVWFKVSQMNTWVNMGICYGMYSSSLSFLLLQGWGIRLWQTLVLCIHAHAQAYMFFPI